jgi:hypothetical protein
MAGDGSVEAVSGSGGVEDCESMGAVMIVAGVDPFSQADCSNLFCSP